MSRIEGETLIRMFKAPREVASAFSKFCTKRGVTVHGAKICTGARGLRGLSAKVDLPAGTQVVRVAAPALIHVGLPFRDQQFRLAMERSRQVFIDVNLMLSADMDAVLPKRFTEMSSEDAKREEILPLRHHQIILAAYLAFVAAGPSTEDHYLRGYMDFLPRTEGFFVPLSQQWLAALDESQLCNVLQSALADFLGTSVYEVRALMVWCLSMMNSRQIPLRDVGMKQRVLADPALYRRGLQSSAGGVELHELLGVPSQEALLRQQSEQLANKIGTLPVLCPVVDLCNHSAINDNVEIDVDLDASGGIALKLMTAVSVNAGDELTMDYGATDEQLRVLWGMTKILP